VDLLDKTHAHLVPLARDLLAAWQSFLVATIVVFTVLLLWTRITRLLDAVTEGIVARLRGEGPMKLGLFELPARSADTATSEWIAGELDAGGGAAVVVGDPDQFVVLFKVKTRTMMRSTKAIELPEGCLVQVSTEKLSPTGGWEVAEATLFVAGVRIEPDTAVPFGGKRGHRLVASRAPHGEPFGSGASKPATSTSRRVDECFPGVSLTTTQWLTSQTNNAPAVVGDPDQFVIVTKVVSADMMRSTKALVVDGLGVLVQISTERRGLRGGWTLAECLTFIPGVTISADEAVRFTKGGHRLVKGAYR
jgi:hypothetical protein